jgi:drug/metabolite transporter (DMT)-like permease
MTRTSPLALIVATVLGGGAGFLVNHLLTLGGRATFSPAVGLPILLALLGAVCLALAWPVRRSVRTPGAPRVDPFRAVRIAILAKASSLVGAVFLGLAGGLLLYVSTRPVSPALGSMSTTIATIAAGAALVIAALVAEHFCSLPKDPDEREPDDAGPSEPAH